jgi:LysR family transcriptional regulator, nitrogen assimilation regulatory protein
LELRQLRYFVSVARERSFSKASEKLHIAQPALSRQIQLLEEELGVELLHRTAKGAHATEAGRRFKEMAEFVLNYIGEIKPTLTQFASEPSGNIVIGLPPSLAFMLAPRLVEETRRRFPLVTLRIIEGLSVFLSEWLEEFRLDLAVLTDYGPVAGIERHFIAEDDMVFVGTPAKLQKYDKIIPLKDIENFPLLITHGFRSIISERLAAEHIVPNYYMELDSIPIAKEMVLRGLFCSIFSYSLVHHEIQQGRLRALRFEGTPVRRRILTAVAENRPQSLTIAAIEGLIKEVVKELPLLLPED